MSYVRSGIGTYGPSPAEPFWPYLPTGMGHDDCGCGGTCGGCGDHGMGLFDSMDPTTWGPGEYIVAGVGGYLAVKLVGDASKVGKRARRSPKSSLGIVGIIALAAGGYFLWQKSQAGAGLGAYMPQGYASPQRLLSPVQSAAISIPAGW